MTEHRIGTREEWLEARLELLAEEKEHTRRSDELADRRRELPWVPVDRDYTFDTEAGPRSLAELFDGRSQLLVYHFMFGPDYAEGCPTCTAAADGFDHVAEHLGARDVAFTCVSRAPLERIEAYRRRMGWSFPWASSSDSEFNFDFGVSFRPEQLEEGMEYNYRDMGPATPLLESGGGPIAHLAAASGTDLAGYIKEAPGLSAFALVDGVAHHTYSTFARGGEFLLGFYPLLDRAPLGRNEGDPPEMWIRRRGEYDG